MNLATIILAAGEGTRMKSGLSKLLHQVAGQPILGYVLDASRSLGADRQIVVVGHERGAVEDWLGDRAQTVHQDEQLGTGHAALMAAPALADYEGPVLVLSGDTPLLTEAALRAVVDEFAKGEAAAVMVVSELDDPTGYGRVIRGDGGAVDRIVEEKDADDAERAIKEINAGIYCFDKQGLFEALEAVDDDNNQAEYYLTDVIGVMRGRGQTVSAVTVPGAEIFGVNSRVDLARAEEMMQRRLKEELMRAGVTFIMPETSYIASGVEVGRDTTIMPHCLIEGGTKIGEGSTIGPGARINNAVLGDRVEAQYAVLRDCRLDDGVQVGPYCSIRPETVLGKGAKAGTFVEIKKSNIGTSSKVPHLSYIGDAEIGEDVNIGAGSITCNYDGRQKHRTIIEDGAFLGSATMLIAPVKIGKGAATGAGSSISKDVPAGGLAVERSEQKILPGRSKRAAGNRKERGDHDS